MSIVPPPCNKREMQYSPDSESLFFTTHYPCHLPAGHLGAHTCSDGSWADAHSEPHPGWNREMHRANTERSKNR